MLKTHDLLTTANGRAAQAKVLFQRFGVIPTDASIELSLVSLDRFLSLLDHQSLVLSDSLAAASALKASVTSASDMSYPFVGNLATLLAAGKLATLNAIDNYVAVASGANVGLSASIKPTIQLSHDQLDVGLANLAHAINQSADFTEVARLADIVVYQQRQSKLALNTNTAYSLSFVNGVELVSSVAAADVAARIESLVGQIKLLSPLNDFLRSFAGLPPPTTPAPVTPRPAHL